MTGARACPLRARASPLHVWPCAPFIQRAPGVISRVQCCPLHPLAHAPAHPLTRPQLQDATAAETAACTKIRDVSQRAKDELTLAKRRRAADFKAVFVRLAEHEIQTGIKRREEWSEVLLQLKSDIDEADN